MIVIGDVHGSYDALVRLLARLPDDKICFAGDLVDRGPDSRKVLELVIENDHDAVKGNHELMMYQSSFDPRIKNMWLRHGGKECIDSYEGDKNLFKQHQKWCKSLPIYKEYKDCVDEEGKYLVVSHAGIVDIWHNRHMTHPGNVFAYGCLWENNWDEMRNREGYHNFFNIFGHSPQKYGASIYGSYACIDGGSFIKDPNYNRIIAMQYPSLKTWEEPVIPDIGIV